MKKHKFLALGLAAMMSMSVFAGCGQGASTSGSTGTATSDSGAQTSEEPTEIIWMIRSDESKNYDAVMAAVTDSPFLKIFRTFFPSDTTFCKQGYLAAFSR